MQPRESTTGLRVTYAPPSSFTVTTTSVSFVERVILPSRIEASSSRAFSSSNEKPAPPPLADKSGYGLRSKKQPLNKGGGSCP